MATKPRARHSTHKSLANEALAVVLAAIAILLLLSVITYDPSDPSWNTAGGPGRVNNLIGFVGAHLGDFFLQLFGLAALVVPVLLVMIAARAFFAEELGFPVRKAVGAALLLIAFSGFLALFPKLGFTVVQHSRSNGGAVGYIVEGALADLMNVIGAAIVLTVASVLTLMLTMEISLAAAAGWVRSRAEARILPRGNRNPVFARVRAWWAERAEQRRRAAMEREAARTETRRQREAERERREADDRLRQDRERKQRAEEMRRRAEEAKRLKEQPPPLVGSTLSPAAGLKSTAATDAAIDNVAVAIIQPEAVAAIETPGPETAAPAPISLSLRQQAAAAILAKQERARSGRALAGEVTMDPDVAEMTSTAYIERTNLPEQAGAAVKPAKEQPVRRKTAIEQLSGAIYKLPAIDILEAPIDHREQAEEDLRERATILAEKCKEFSVTGHIHRINPGPVVTTFEFKPDPGIKYSRVVGLADDLCLALKAESIRIDRIPGKSTVGIEVPNLHREKIFLRDIIESPKFQQSESKLTIALGQTINGEEYIADLARMPHLLIAGATGAGKSVTLNALVCSILYKASPEEVKFIMVDPKRVELGLYESIPHLLTPIVTDPKRAANALKWAVNEMESRYRELATHGVRNIEQYNRQVREMTHPTLFDDHPDAPRPLPYIVIAIDELADLMMIARGDVETSIARLAQMARAVGIHLVLATQRPSVDIITGVIKANIPSRIAFRVSSKVDSRTIIDANGAEALLGQGDMLFLPPGTARLVRVHGSFVNEVEVKNITDHTRKQAEPQYNEQVTMNEQEAESSDDYAGEQDGLYDEALAIVTDMSRASTSVLQRRLSIGYGRAAKILDMMERRGFIGPAEGAKPRKVLQAAYEFRDRVEQRLEEAVE